ncbi:AzlC family ABC transporter permease [Parendozoicomonas sp. Alg238-R29]|uniref:AzlC family ABC transporter permease n=1 Tax=Parendozoicomonas sp. Alg238-R29 TaxID=2993446 RepID=UPI00248E21BA|nr:AzlC family ABC transporter permease [Parendozoicomonas sp. Alg238-R29]
MTTSQNRSAFLSGMLAMLPVTPGIIPFAMISGMAALDAGMSPLTAQLYSVFVFAGASQIAAAQLITSHAEPLVIILTIWIINLRFVMYSASMSSKLPPSSIPKALQAYVMTDQSFAICAGMFDQNQVPYENRAMFYLGSSVIMWLIWQMATGVGIAFGSIIPTSWSLDFGVWLCFIAIMIPGLKDFPAIIAALVGGSLALALHGLPFNLGLVIASVVGIACGYLTEKKLSSNLPVKSDNDAKERFQ